MNECACAGRRASQALDGNPDSFVLQVTTPGGEGTRVRGHRQRVTVTDWLDLLPAASTATAWMT